MHVLIVFICKTLVIAVNKRLTIAIFLLMSMNGFIFVFEFDSYPLDIPITQHSDISPKDQTTRCMKT